MTIPAHFPAHWRAAIEAGDDRFADQQDLFKFFDAVEASWLSLSAEERQSTFSINGQHEDDRMVYLRNLKAGRFFGNCSATAAAAAPTFAELRPEIEAINAEIDKASASSPPPWAGVIERINASFDALAPEIYARRKAQRAHGGD